MTTQNETPSAETGTQPIEDLEGKCMALWLLNGHETEEWNGDSCNCEIIQGIYNCKLNPF
jgi:hypothetical protein